MTRFLFLIIILWCAQGTAASFNCSKAASLSEVTTCNDSELSKLDDELSIIYKRAKEAAKDKKRFMQQSNASWKWREANCHTRECLFNWYTQRKATLEKITKAGFLVNASNVIYLSLKEASRGAELPLNSPEGVLYPSKIQIYYNQTRLDLVAVFSENKRVRLPYNFNIGYETDGEMSWEMKGNEYAIAQHDVTGDGRDEIIFTVLVADDGMSKAQVNVFQFFPPEHSSDLERKSNWALVGSLQAIGIIGTPRIVIKDKSITIPRNFRKFYYEITWVKDKFLNAGNY